MTKPPSVFQALRRRVRPFVPDAIVNRVRGTRQKETPAVTAPVKETPSSHSERPAFCHVAHYDPSTDMNGAKMRLVEIASALQSINIDVYHIRTTDYSVYTFSSDGAFRKSGRRVKDICTSPNILGVIFAWAWIFESRNKILDNMGFTSTRPLLIYDSIDFLPLRTQREYESTLMQQRTVNLSMDQEISCTRNADITLAVTDEERIQFEKLGAKATLVLGYAQREIHVRPRPTTRIGGFFGSYNTANLYSAFRSATLAKMSGRFSKFVIAGSVCNYKDEIEEFRDLFGWDWLCVHGIAKTVASYYQQIDVAVHILAFGSGIKIKNVESLSYGVPLITNLVGAEGIDVEDGAGMWVVETLSEFERAADEALKMQSGHNSSGARLARTFDMQVRALAERASWQ